MVSIKKDGRLIGVVVMIQLFFLSVQFLLGMWINLFAPAINAALPTNAMSFMMTVMVSIPEILIHMIVGVLVGIISLILVAFSLSSGEIKIFVFSISNALFVLLAGISGILFLLSFMENNIFSFAMSISFLAVILTDFSILYYVPALSR
ncbi:MAG: hypothetical protein QXO03_02965 [Thermoplasmatales archaeon]